MLTRSITPMRSTIGLPVPFKTAEVVLRSTELQRAGGQISLNVYGRQSELSNLSYRDFLPEKLELPFTSLTPAADSWALPQVVDLPFADGAANFVSLSARFPQGAPVPSRALWFEVRVRFQEEVLLGGLCYSGHPSLPYYVNQQGENSSNFGLPREIRVRWKGHDAGFIDDETAVTYQEPTSHGGVHYLCTGPVKTDWLILRFGDFPKFLSLLRLDPEGNVQAVGERHGLLMPFLYFFSYREEARFRPHVPAGLLATLRRRNEESRTAERRLSADFNHASGNTYLTYSGAGMLGQRRAYTSPGGEEVFCSVPLTPRDAVEVYAEQAEEHARCVAGARVKFAKLELAGVAKRGAARLRVYEIDPPEGGSPLNAMRPEERENKKYAFLLYDEPVAADKDSVVCKFVRPSSSRYFALVMTNEEARAVQFAIEELEFVQSVHVAVSPRPSRSQTVSQMHYRIVGKALADDYARLGPEGFSMSVELLMAGERKSVLFSAASLLELLESGGARLYANHRYLESTTYEERTETLPGGFEEQSVCTWSDGWRRSESGDAVAARWDTMRRSWGHLDDPLKDAVTPSHDPSQSPGFHTFANSETRSHTEVIGHEANDGLREQTRLLFEQLLPESAHLPKFDPKSDPRLLADGGGEELSWKRLVWKGIKWVDANGLPNTDLARVGVISNLTIPPNGIDPDAYAKLQDGVGKLFGLIQSPTGLPDGLPADEIINNLRSGAARFLNGASWGFSFGFSYYVGGSVSVSGPQVIPHMVYSSSVGTTGNINKQASLTGYSYAQALNKGFERARVRTESHTGASARNVTRRELYDPANTERARGVEVRWQDDFADIVAGSVPVNVTLPATAGRSYRTADEMLLVRFGKGVGTAVEVEVWFDVTEEVVRDDY